MNFLISIIDKICYNKNIKNNIIKFGIDSTNYSIHIGHIFLINFIFFLLNKKFKIIIIIGDFTAKIKKNINLIVINSICLKSQLNNFFGDISIFFNSIWLSKINFTFFVKLLKIFNLNKYINKTTKNNIKNNNLKINELIYPLLQAYDSIIINSNYEIGGRDQLFNIFLGRIFQKKKKLNKQNIITLILIECKNKKISKSSFNSFNLNDNIFLIKKIFFNLKLYFKNFIKQKKFLMFFYNYKLKKKIIVKYFYYKFRNFLSFYLKNLNINKNFFFNLLYLKKIKLQKKIIIKNFILKKKNYNFFFFKLDIYDKFY